MKLADYFGEHTQEQVPHQTCLAADLLAVMMMYVLQHETGKRMSGQRSTYRVTSTSTMHAQQCLAQ